MALGKVLGVLKVGANAGQLEQPSAGTGGRECSGEVEQEGSDVAWREGETEVAV